VADVGLHAQEWDQDIGDYRSGQEFNVSAIARGILTVLK